MCIQSWSILFLFVSALKFTHGGYILNGGWQLAHSGEYDGAGTTFHYHRTPQDRLINGKERVFTKGPTNDSVDIMVRLCFLFIANCKIVVYIGGLVQDCRNKTLPEPMLIYS